MGIIQGINFSRGFFSSQITTDTSDRPVGLAIVQRKTKTLQPNLFVGHFRNEFAAVQSLFFIKTVNWTLRNRMWVFWR